MVNKKIIHNTIRGKVYTNNQILNERYKLLNRLGSGGFSVVWLAEDLYTRSKVAVKIFAPDKGLDENGLKQFQKEYVRTRGIKHPNLLVPEHFDIIQISNSPFLVLPYCSNGSLDARIREKGALSEKEIAQVLVEVCGGLAELHRKGILHQDIKPDNVLIDEEKKYQLTDFGISRDMRSTLNKATANQSYLTVSYSAPERYLAKPVDTFASDIFSVGVMLYELCTTHVPWDGAGGMVLNAGAQIPSLPEPYSRRLNAIIELCLDPEHENRPTAEQLAVAGQTFLKDGFWVDINPKEEAKAPIKKPLIARKTQKIERVKVELDQKKNNNTVLLKSANQKNSSKLKAIVFGSLVMATMVVIVVGFSNNWFKGSPAVDPTTNVINPNSFGDINIGVKKTETKLPGQDSFEKGLQAYIKKDEENATKWMVEAAGDDFADAYYYLGVLLSESESNNQTIHLKLLTNEALFKRGVELGDKKAYFGLAQYVAPFMSYTQDSLYNAAFPEIERAAIEGNPVWQTALGYYYAGVLSTTLDNDKTNYQAMYDWLLKAANQQYVNAELRLAYIFFNGNFGFDQDYEKAKYWYEKAAENGNAYAQYQLGTMYEYGLGMNTNDLLALDWYLKAAEQDYESAINKVEQLKGKNSTTSRLDFLKSKN